MFHIYGDFREGLPNGTGHINDTCAAVFDQSGGPVRNIFQRINQHVFKNPCAVMENVSCVTAHVRQQLEGSQADPHGLPPRRPLLQDYREGHNADRARVQFKMVESIERNEKAMDQVVRDANG
jgi:hypothetical protein